MQNNSLTIRPHFLWFLTLSYTMVMVIANWFDPRLIKIAGLITDAGTLVFPLTFLLSDMITEVYGYKHARRAIWCGFLFNAIFILYAQIVIHLPSPDFPNKNQLFDSLLTTNTRIIFASASSYFIAEPLNSYVMAKLKIRTHGRYLGFRFVCSTLLAAGLDSFVFSVLAFYGMMNNHNLLLFIITMWLIKVVIEMIGLPISIRLVNKLKTIEQLDIYDTNTNFNIFRLDATYQKKNNALDLS